MVNRDAFEEILGNEVIKTSLIGFTERKAFPHSLLISGPRGSGKSAIARLAVLSIACQSENKRPCLTCEACRKIREGISPDVITVDLPADRRTIGVDTVREIRESAYVKPNDLSVKIYMIENADKLTDAAQNALLKLLEEPPHGVYFMLMASDVTALLPTVRSRAPELRPDLFDHGTMERYLTEHSKKAAILRQNDPAAFQRILHAAVGSYGRALALIENRDKKTAKAFERVETALRLLTESNRADFLTLLLAEASDRSTFSDFLRLFSTALRDLTASRRCREVPELLFFADADEASTFSAAFTLPTLLRLYNELERLSGQISDINVNLNTAAVTVANRLWELK